MATKFEHSSGWYKVSGSGRRFEVTYLTDSGLTFCENIRVGSYKEAVDYCRSRIHGLTKRPTPIHPENKEEPPFCSADCTYRQKFTGFDLQRNALRSELATMVDPWRCGWNLKPGCIGGRPLDYAPCTCKEGL